ncbi:hypothetical protein D3C75_584640 [compost metagenome]
MPRVAQAGEDFAEGFVGQGVEAAEHHHMAELAKAVLVGQEHQQLLAGIEPAASQAQPDFASKHRQVRGHRVFVGAGTDAQGGGAADQQVDA